MMRDASLRARLLVGVLAAVAACWILTAVTGYFAARHELDELLDAHLAETTATLVAQLGEDADDVEAEHTPQWHRYSTQIAFQVWHRGRHLALHSKSAPSKRLSALEEGFSTSEIEGKRWRVFSAWTSDHEMLVQVGELVAARQMVAGEIVRHMLTPLVVALPVLAIVLAVAITRGLKPLNELAAEVGGLAPDRLEPFRVDGVPAEVRPLVAQLNGLFGRIGESIASERRFTADAAHELRTPIAAIRAQAQVALGATDDQQRTDASVKVIQGCDRASHLIDQLLTLARLDVAVAGASMPRAQLDEVVRQTAALLAPAAHGKGIALEFETAGEVGVKGDPMLLGVLARNLIDNAIRYSPPGTTVIARVGSTNGLPMLEVSDEGPGIPVAERGKVIERFYRMVRGEQPGSGLGLSIVARIAALCAARLELGDGPAGRGLTVRVLFPAPQA